MNNFVSRVCLVAFVALGFVLVNAVVVHCVVGCPGVGTTTVPCINGEAYNNGACRLGTNVFFDDEGNFITSVLTCFGGSLTIGTKTVLAFGVSGSQITYEGTDDCASRTSCVRVKKDGASGEILGDYSCDTEVETTASVTFGAGECPESPW